MKISNEYFWLDGKTQFGGMNVPRGCYKSCIRGCRDLDILCTEINKNVFLSLRNEHNIKKFKNEDLKKIAHKFYDLY